MPVVVTQLMLKTVLGGGCYSFCHFRRGNWGSDIPPCLVTTKCLRKERKLCICPGGEQCKPGPRLSPARKVGYWEGGGSAGNHPWAQVPSSNIACWVSVSHLSRGNKKPCPWNCEDSIRSCLSAQKMQAASLLFFPEDIRIQNSVHLHSDICLRRKGLYDAQTKKNIFLQHQGLNLRPRTC
jgi:hypothetical protein